MRSGLCGGGVAVGERQEGSFQFSFNGRVRFDSQGARVTSDAGLLLVRELDERLGFGELIERHLTEVIDSGRRVVLDMDSTEVPVYGRQEQRGYNRHFESACHHPLLLPRKRLRGGDTAPGRRPQRDRRAAGAGFGEAVGREKCLRNRLEKRHFWGLHGRQTLNRPIPARLAAP